MPKPANDTTVKMTVKEVVKSSMPPLRRRDYFSTPPVADLPGGSYSVELESLGREYSGVYRMLTNHKYEVGEELQFSLPTSSFDAIGSGELIKKSGTGPNSINFTGIQRYHKTAAQT